MRIIMIDERKFDSLFKETETDLRMTKIDMRTNPEHSAYIDKIHKRFEQHLRNLKVRLREG